MFFCIGKYYITCITYCITLHKLSGQSLSKLQDLWSLVCCSSGVSKSWILLSNWTMSILYKTIHKHIYILFKDIEILNQKWRWEMYSTNHDYDCLKKEEGTRARAWGLLLKTKGISLHFIKSKVKDLTKIAKQKERHRCTEQNFGLYGRRRGWDVSREQHWNMYIIQGETDHQPRLDAWNKCSGLVHGWSPEGSGGEGGGRGDRDGEHM